MRLARVALIVTFLLAWIPVTVAAQDEPPAIDLAAIPLAPAEMAEPGYLLEGGGYLTEIATIENLISSLDGGDAGGFSDRDWLRSYMYRVVLLADTEDPGSDLLADKITLVHEFESPEAARSALESMHERLAELGEPVGESGEISTHAIFVDSVQTLNSVYVADAILLQVITSDLTGPPDAGDHAADVEATIARLGEVASSGDPGLSASVVVIDDGKLMSFADSPDAHQHYLTRDSAWLPAIGFPQRDRATDEFAISGVYESQQLMVLNTGDQIQFQVWLAAFSSSDAATAFVADLPLAEIPTMMFSDQADATADGEGFSVRGVLDDGNRYSGYRTVTIAGDHVLITGLLGSGDQLVTRDQANAFAGVQIACLREGVCDPVPAGELLNVEGDTTPETTPETEGLFASSQFPWSVDYAAAGWELRSVEDVQGVDYLDLLAGDSLGSIETVVDRHGDPTQCIIESLRLLEEFEEHAAITLGSDVANEREAGMEPGHAWAVYTVEPLADERADQEYTIRLDCYTLIEGEASLVVTHTAPRDSWETESAKGAALRANIVIQDVAAATSDGSDVQARIVDVLVPRIWIPLAA